MTKVDLKKIARKVKKCVAGISKDICVKLTEGQVPSRHVLLCNAGLVTGFSREEVVSLFSPFGIIEKVVMLPGKSYSFVSFADVQSSANSVEELNGSLCLENGTQPIYLCFVEEIDGKNYELLLHTT